MFLKYSLMGALLCSTALTVATGASAQDAATSKAPPTAAPADNVEVVVTARSRAEKLQKVPDAITALSGTTIDKAGVQNVADVTRFVPNVDFRTGYRAGTAQITVRGIGTPQGGDLPIALVVDGVQMPGVDFFNQDLLDVAQVQVLRGPQGALYGQGALAGAMLITSREPTDNFEFNGKESFSSGDTYHLAGSVSGPVIKDKLYFRLAGSYRKSDGTIRNVNGQGVNYVDEPFIRGELHYDAGGGFRATLAANYDKGKNGAIYQNYAPVRSDGTYDLDNFKNNPITSNILGRDNREISGGSLRMEQDLGGGVISSTTSYNRLTDLTYGDADWTANNIVSQYNKYNVRLANEDLRYTSASNEPLRYVFGAFAQTRTIDEALQVPFLSGSGKTGYAANTADRQDRQSWALFAQVNYNITSKMELTGALRYDDNEAKFHNLFTDARLKKDYNKVQPKVSVAYNWTDTLMTYATYAIGYRSGGFNSASSVFAGPIIMGETSGNEEVGFKARLFGGLATIDASAFHIEQKHAQLYFASSSPPSQNVINVDSSHTDGLEVEAQLRPTKNFYITESLGISNAVIDDFNGTGLNDKTPFPNVPAFTSRTAANYDFNVGGDNTLTPSIGIYNRGKIYYLAGKGERSGGFTDIDLRLNYSTPKWSIAAYVSNLTDERHGEEPNNKGLRSISDPRVFGIELSEHFR